jgi:hypothetical protein
MADMVVSADKSLKKVSHRSGAGEKVKAKKMM